MEDFVKKLEDATKKGDDGVPGVLGAVGVVVGGKGAAKQLTTHASGQTSLLPSSPPITSSSILRLASCTKLITALTALRLVHRGVLSLTSPSLISTHLPELCSQPVFSSPQEGGIASGPGSLTYEERKTDITLKHLLTHSSGSGYDMLDPRLLAWRQSRGEGQLALSGDLPYAITYPLLFQPGEGWSYGGGFDWIGLLIERVTGRRLGDVMRDEVFDVVGCDAGIGFTRSDVEAVGGETVQCVVRTKEWSLAGYPAVDAKSDRGGGGLFASAENFAKVLADIVAEEPRVLPKEYLDLVFSPQFVEGGSDLQALRAQSPIFLSMTGALTGALDASAVNHSLGGLLITEDNPALGKTKGTVTWGGAFNCVWFANRERKLAGFYGSSMFPPGEPRSSELMGEFVRGAWKGAD